MSTSIEEYDQRVLDKYHDSLNVYWGALLTINGLLFSFFSADSIKHSGVSPLLNYLLIILCSISLCLIIYNFRVIKKNYYELGRMTADDMPDVPPHLITDETSPEEMSRLIDVYTEEWRAKDIKRAARSQKVTRIREGAIEILMVLEIFIILAILFTPTLNEEPTNSLNEKHTIVNKIQKSTRVDTSTSDSSVIDTFPPNKGLELTHTK